MQVVTYESKDGVAIISLNRPERRNALNSESYVQIAAALRRFQEGEDRVAILRGEGSQFCSGADLGDLPRHIWKGTPNVGIHLTKPLIAAVHGLCIGAGFTLVMMCDLAVAEQGAKFSFPEGRVGVFGGIVASLVVRIPQKVATEFLMFGEPMSAERAYEVGFVNRIAPAGQLMDSAMAMATKLAAMSPRVLASIKDWTLKTLPKSPAETFYPEMAVIQDMMESEDFKEGIAAFHEKRAPGFTGR